MHVLSISLQNSNSQVIAGRYDSLDYVTEMQQLEYVRTSNVLIIWRS